MSDDDKGQPIRVPGREANSRPLPKRFYQHATAEPDRDGAGFHVSLDGRPARTPGRRKLLVPTKSLAEAVASEWEAQDKVVDPARMPLTRLVNTAIDGVADQRGQVGADIVKYSGSDLLCYRANFPGGLVERQKEAWDPLLAWFAEHHAAAFVVADGLMPVTQPDEATDAVARIVVPLDEFRLTALHVMTTLTGSALLALAVHLGRLTAESGWEAAHIDEDWQIAEWGEDAEAAARRATRWQEMRAAATLARLLDE